MLKIAFLTKNMALPRWFCVVCPLILGGCVADIFGERAVSYNQEAATNKDKTILTNIVRAALGRPLQFTELTTVSGTASQSLSVAGVIPFAVHRPPTVGISDTVTPTASLSGGPTFSVANLSTKEFYSGILSPLQTSILGYYLSVRRYPLLVLLTLTVSEISFGQKDQPVRIPNSITSYDFRDMINELLLVGLTTERVDASVAESPALSENEAKDPKLLASLAAGAAAGNATLELKRYAVPSNFADADDTNLSSAEYQQLKTQKRSMYFRLEKKSTTYRFCFQKNLLKKQLEGLGLTYRFPVDIILPIANSPTLSISEQNICGSKVHEAGDLVLKQLSANVKIETRSVVEMIDFLGEIVRSETAFKVYRTPRGGGEITVFSATQKPDGGANLSATVDGKTYYINVDASGENESSRVLELLAELIALNSSAKDLPAPNVITVISP
jgi:hypothetical protein